MDGGAADMTIAVIVFAAEVPGIISSVTGSGCSAKLNRIDALYGKKFASAGIGLVGHGSVAVPDTSRCPDDP